MFAITEDSIFLHESIICGHHIFKEIWTPHIGEFCYVRKEAGTFMIGTQLLCSKQMRQVGHVPREVSRAFWHYLGHGGKISYEITGSRYGKLHRSHVSTSLLAMIRWLRSREELCRIPMNYILSLVLLPQKKIYNPTLLHSLLQL